MSMSYNCWETELKADGENFGQAHVSTLEQVPRAAWKNPGLHHFLIIK